MNEYFLRQISRLESLLPRVERLGLAGGRSFVEEASSALRACADRLPADGPSSDEQLAEHFAQRLASERDPDSAWGVILTLGPAASDLGPWLALHRRPFHVRWLAEVSFVAGGALKAGPIADALGHGAEYRAMLGKLSEASDEGVRGWAATELESWG